MPQTGCFSLLTGFRVPAGVSLVFFNKKGTKDLGFQPAPKNSQETAFYLSTRKSCYLVIRVQYSKSKTEIKSKTVLQFRSQSTSTTSPLSKSTPNCSLSAFFRNSLSSYKTLHSHSKFRPRCSTRISFTAKSSRPWLRHRRSRCCLGFQFQFLGSWS